MTVWSTVLKSMRELIEQSGEHDDWSDEYKSGFVEGMETAVSMIRLAIVLKDGVDPDANL